MKSSMYMYQSPIRKCKLEIIDQVKHLPAGKKTDTAAKLQILPSKKQGCLQSNYVVGSSKESSKCQRDHTHIDIDSALFQWLIDARAQSLPISRKIPKAKVEEPSS